MRAIFLPLALAACGGTAEPELAPDDRPAAVVESSDASEIFSADVFVVTGTGDLIPADPRTTAPGTPLFNIAGEPLPATWGSWSAATGTARAHCTRRQTHATIELAGLIPGGVYSVFSTTFSPDSANPVCPAIDRSVVAVESFTAGRKGHARVHARSEGCLLDAQQVTYAVIYHFDGRTWGEVPNAGEANGCRSTFGDDAERQLLILQQGF
ncbi:MAG TPA: hypothetical protein VLW85_21460 [Myxococcales bacterium]|nr:hypothetical protein [Myxococcales bacterium]